MKAPAVWFRLIIGDHFRRVAGLTRLQRGALNDLIVQYFSKGYLTTDERVLARLCEMSRKEWLDNREAIMEAGQFMDDWRADWIEAELKNVDDRREQTAKGRAVLAEKRKAQPTQPGGNFSEKTDTETVSQSQSQSQSDKERGSPMAGDCQAGPGQPPGTGTTGGPGQSYLGPPPPTTTLQGRALHGRSDSAIGSQKTNGKYTNH